MTTLGSENRDLLSENLAMAELLAIIHRDGGHRTEEIGIIASVEEAKGKYYQLVGKLDNLLFELGEVKTWDRLDKVIDKYK